MTKLLSLSGSRSLNLLTHHHQNVYHVDNSVWKQAIIKRPWLFSCSRIICARRCIHKKAHTLYLAWPVNLLKTYNPLNSSHAWMRSEDACIQSTFLEKASKSQKTHTQPFSWHVLLVSVQTLQSWPPLITEVAKNKSQIWLDSDATQTLELEQGRTDPSVKVTHLLSVTSLWPAEEAAIAIGLSVNCGATSEVFRMEEKLGWTSWLMESVGDRCSSWKSEFKKVDEIQGFASFCRLADGLPETRAHMHAHILCTITLCKCTCVYMGCRRIDACMHKHISMAPQQTFNSDWSTVLLLVSWHPTILSLLLTHLFSLVSTWINGSHLLWLWSLLSSSLHWHSRSAECWALEQPLHTWKPTGGCV